MAATCSRQGPGSQEARLDCGPDAFAAFGIGEACGITDQQQAIRDHRSISHVRREIRVPAPLEP